MSNLKLKIPYVKFEGGRERGKLSREREGGRKGVKQRKRTPLVLL